MSYDLTTMAGRRELAWRIGLNIDDYAQAEYGQGHRDHLGASLIGNECSRYLWSIFRWLKKEEFDPRILRLFQRGHREEDVFSEYIRGIRGKIETHDEGGEDQLRIEARNKHFGGSIDGLVTLPAEYGISDKLIAEFKTNGTGKGFNDLVEHGVKSSKFQHYVQMCVYGKHLDIKYGLYICVNKNDDSLHVEIVELDHLEAEIYINRAEDVINSQFPPAKISEQSSYWKCKMCNFQGICHLGELVEKNCRSCKNASAIKDGTWNCSLGGEIPEDFIAKGCDYHDPIA